MLFPCSCSYVKMSCCTILFSLTFYHTSSYTWYFSPTNIDYLNFCFEGKYLISCQRSTHNFSMKLLSRIISLSYLSCGSPAWSWGCRVAGWEHCAGSSGFPVTFLMSPVWLLLWLSHWSVILKKAWQHLAVFWGRSLLTSSCACVLVLSAMCLLFMNSG